VKRLLTVVLELALLFIFCDTAEAATGSMVHNGPGHYTGWIQVPWSKQHYHSIPTYGHTRDTIHKPVKKHATVTKSKKKRVLHFKSAASKARFYRWYFATHKKN
jgi:hypothetical protein